MEQKTASVLYFSEHNKVGRKGVVLQKECAGKAVCRLFLLTGAIISRFPVLGWSG